MNVSSKLAEKLRSASRVGDYMEVGRLLFKAKPGISREDFLLVAIRFMPAFIRDSENKVVSESTLARRCWNKLCDPSEVVKPRTSPTGSSAVILAFAATRDTFRACDLAVPNAARILAYLVKQRKLERADAGLYRLPKERVREST